MSPAEIDTMRSVEDDLWWYRGLRKHVADSIQPSRSDFDLLDAGCGSGGMLAWLRRRFPDASLTGLDFVPRALQLTGARETGAKLVQGSIDQMPFADATFDFVVSLDVIIIHGIDQSAAAREMHRVLRPGGTLIVNVPAFGFLRGRHDIAVSIGRRYTKPELTALLQDAGFSVESLTYWNMSLLPVVAAVRWASRTKDAEPNVRSDLAPIWRPLNQALTTLARAELAASRRVSLPFGTSLFAVARK